MPKKPTVNAVIGFITKDSPKNPPMKLNKSSNNPPITPLAINFTIILMGITNSIPTIYNRNRPNIRIIKYQNP